MPSNESRQPIPYQRPTIGDLFGLCGPSHIARFIMAIVVRKTVKRMRSGWPTSEGINKLLKCLETKLNTPTPVMFICRLVRILAALFRVHPGTIFGGPIAVHRFAVPHTLRTQLALQTAAGQGPLKGRHNQFADCPAFATAEPHRRPARPFGGTGVAQDCPTPVSLARAVTEVRARRPRMRKEYNIGGMYILPFHIRIIAGMKS